MCTVLRLFLEINEFCGALRNIPGGETNVPAGAAAIGDSVSYKCAHGYKFTDHESLTDQQTNSVTLTCESDEASWSTTGNWSRAVPACERTWSVARK